MKYKGFIITPVYYLCADWKLAKLSRVVRKKVTKKDIHYYEVLDPMENNKRFFAEDTIQQCKTEIDRLLTKLGMKDNKPESWAKLDWR